MSYETGLIRRLARSRGFDDWELDGTRLAGDGSIELDRAKAREERDPGPPGENAYSGGAYLVGEATSPELAADFPFADAIPSWNASARGGAWLEVLLRARVAGVPGAERGADPPWTRWYGLGVWAEDGSAIERRSVAGQDDEAGSVSCDTLSLKAPAALAQVRLRLFGPAAGDAGAARGRSGPESSPSPNVRAVALAYSTPKPKAPLELLPGDPRLWDRIIPGVPQASQMVYQDIRKGWCSPTSVSMVLGYWAGSTDGRDRGERVREAAAGVYDKVYGGHGNWSFNVAYAATKGFEACVARFAGLSRLEPVAARGIPVVLSVSWNEGQGRPLSGAPIAKSNGHLILLVGFDARGNPVVHDPAAKTNEEVRRIYDRVELESRWLEASGGAAYLIHPAGMQAEDPLPPR